MPRRYSEEEAQRIFAHVAERQRHAARSDAGLSLDDLQEAARAAGLDPDLVVQAAASLDAPSPERAQTLLGAPVEVVQQRMLPEAVSDETWAQLVALARSTFGSTGIAGQIGRLREWTLLGPGGAPQSDATRLALEPTPDGTRLTLSRSSRALVLGPSIAASVMGALGVLFVLLFAAGVDPDLVVPAVLMVGMAVAVGAGSQIGARMWHRAQTRRFEAFLDRAELIVRSAPDASARATGPDRVEAAPSRLDLDALEVAPDAATSVAPTRTRS